MEETTRALDDVLALRSRRGDPAALAELYRRYAGRLVGYLQRFTRCHEDSQDLMQETFLKVLQGRGEFTARGRFRSWLFTIATRTALDRLRQEKRREELLSRQTSPREAVGADAVETASRHLLSQRLELVLDDLSPEQAMLFQLRLREGLSYKEIAEISGVSEGTLRSRVHHLLKHLHAKLADEPAKTEGKNQDERLA